MAKSPLKNIAVIGAGWAGCTAAVELVKRGHKVQVFETARTLGGRARQVESHQLTLDNGQHILLGAYRQSLQVMRDVGVDINQSFLRLPLQMMYPPLDDGMQFSAPSSPLLPAPLHLLIALWQSKGLEKEDKLALARFSSTARWMGWKLYEDCTVNELLQRFGQTERLCKLMWYPLCIAALNTPPHKASAQVFLNILRDSLGAKRSASDMLIPKLNLTALFPEKAAAFLQSKGSQVTLGKAVTQITKSINNPKQWSLAFSNDETMAGSNTGFDAVVIATDVNNAQRLLKSASSSSTLPDFEFEAITTCYLQYPVSVRLPLPMYALRDDVPRKKWGQYVFDRGYLHDDQTGLLAVVVSAPENIRAIDHTDLAQAIALQLAESLGLPALERPLWHQIITEKRATISCTPGLTRPPNITSDPGLVIAGDYTAGDYPATLEAAVRSGIAAAELLQ